MRRDARRIITVICVCLCLGLTACGGSSNNSQPHTTDAARTPSVAPSPTLGQPDPPVASFDPNQHKVIDHHGNPDRRKLNVPSSMPQGMKPASGRTMHSFLTQRITWNPCGDKYCAKVEVPLDWDHPEGPTITLALKKHAADKAHGSGKGHRSGKGQGATLFLNPGGPGGSGQEMLDTFETDQFADYDVIGWDPRGTGESTPVRCGTDAQTDAFHALDFTPHSQAEWNALTSGATTFAQQCRQASGALLDHVSSIDSARDLDYLRHLVGDGKLTYLGVSYGTYLGAMYAELYPQRVGRMVLDSAVNITTKEPPSQQEAFDKSFHEFATWCAQPRSHCPLKGTPDQIVDQTKGFLDHLGSRRLTVRTVNKQAKLSETDAATGIALFLYLGRQGYQQLAGALSAALNDHDGSQLYAAAGYMYGRDPMSGKYDPTAYAFPAISCLDTGDDGMSEVRQDWDEARKTAPLLGEAMGADPVCAVWSTTPVPQLKLTAHAAAPIVVLGVTGDPATPYQQAQWMAQQLESAVLVTWKGSGHSAWSLGNQCLKDSVTSYINDGTVPKDGKIC